MAIKFFKKRKNVRIILWIITILIIPGFFFWGVGIGSDKKSQYAAIVNREPISLREFYDQLWKVEQKYREIFGENYSQIKDKLNIEKNVLENLIREKLLLQQARKKRIRVYKNEIVSVIKQDPIFKNEKGEFDEEKFKQIISNYPEEELAKIEQEIKKEILLQKLKEQVVSETTIDVSDKEVEDYLKFTGNEKIDRENIRKMILWQKKENYFEDWYKKLREKSKIIIYLPLEKKIEEK
ncbi:MAG: SurA N-terminal domain-containing protein [Candidatus Omnitrophica bacterium]|nr:SurA N-terminal domain-containing protein [Candidatus Omnitrophota bacterium]MCM8809107.1 SurA N-terminal domain-containing protein [Candidatus Omnitrophota bacterium]MCM8810777.1 SurA N-terminal domain-containing protein [Candidatus Omnitrophota bacterium]